MEKTIVKTLFITILVLICAFGKNLTNDDENIKYGDEFEHFDMNYNSYTFDKKGGRIVFIRA